MGETPNQSFQVSFNPSLRVDFQGARVRSDSGLLVVRELDERLGLNELIEEHLTDQWRGKNTQLPLPDLLRQSIHSRLAGYEDVNDAERLSQDPTFRLIGSEKIWERPSGAEVCASAGEVKPRPEFCALRRESLYPEIRRNGWCALLAASASAVLHSRSKM